MNRLLGRVTAAAVVALATALPAQAADKHGVKDDAKFFSPDAVEKANRQLDELATKKGVHVRIETVNLPEAEKEKVKGRSKEDVRKHFRDWANKRFNDLGLNARSGFVLVVRSPSEVQSHFGRELLPIQKPVVEQIIGGLTAAKGKSADPVLDSVMATITQGTAKFASATAPQSGSTTAKTGSATSGIREGAAKTAESVKNTSRDVYDSAKKDAAKGKEAVQGMSTSTLIILGVIVALVMLFALKGLFGGGSRQPGGYAPPPTNYGGPPGGGGQGMNQPLGYGRQPAPPPPQGYPQGGYPQQSYPQGGSPQQPQQGGGGGFMKGVLGGMLGGAAGAYMYDKMTGGQAHGGTPTGGGAYPGGEATGGAAAGGADYGGTGDFGEAPASGGDYGGGGDFADAGSGGDYGGGGDFTEASGGDYGGGGDFGADDAGGGDFGGDSGGGGDFDDES